MAADLDPAVSPRLRILRGLVATFDGIEQLLRCAAVETTIAPNGKQALDAARRHLRDLRSQLLTFFEDVEWK